MRISMRDQLCAFVVLTTLCALGILTIVTWVYNRNLVTDLRSSRLEVIASLKARQFSQALLVFSSSITALSARQTIINALKADIASDQNATNIWANASTSLAIVLSSYQDIVYVAAQNANLTDSRMNITSLSGESLFPGRDGDVALEDSLGQLASYNSIAGPPEDYADLIPAIQNKLETTQIDPSFIGDTGLFLGPVQVFNGSNPVFLASLTVPIYNNTTIASNMRNTLGYFTIVFSLASVMDVVNDTQGLGNTGQVLVLGPANVVNRWNRLLPNGHFNVTRADKFKYVLPAIRDSSLALTNATAGSYMQALRAWRLGTPTITASGSDMDTHNAQGKHVTVGFANIQYAPTNSSMLLIAEQAYSETQQPINELRNIAVGTVFGVAGIVMLLTLPLAHYAVKPIRRLREATKRGGRPPDYTENPKIPYWIALLRRFRRQPSSSPRDDAEMDVVSMIGSRTSSERRYAFHIPQKVADRKRLFNDELSDLTVTFNSMTAELLVQYENLDEKVQQRTKELEDQKRLAEAANEAKSMFVANLSHELKTPLNGILGMCSLVMAEEDLPARSRKNLEVVFKSGELLLHLLTDLLTFSKNQVTDAAAQVKLEERAFKIKEFTTQILALFSNQAQESGIDLSCEVQPPHGIDWELTGDMNRILQVVINLVSNSLKFTPRKGSVQLMIVMDSTEVPQDTTTKDSGSKTPDGRPSISPFRFPSDATSSTQYEGKTADGRPQRPAPMTRRSSNGIVNPNSLVNKRLLNNAESQTPATGSTTSLNIDEVATRSAFFEFRVIDTGPGVPEHLQEKIFEPFIQGDVGLSRKYGGTGLGLSICSQLATIMGGEIRLKSFENAGSTFTLRIPLKFTPSSTRGGGISTPRRQMSARSRATNNPRRSLALENSRDSQSVHSMLSAAFTAVSVQDVANQDNVRLVGLSQPFFAPSNPDEQQMNITPRPGTAEDVPAYTSTQRIIEVKEEKRARTPDVQPSMARGGSVRKQKEPEEVGDSAAPEPSDDDSIKVLVAEDNKVNQKVVMKMLQVEGIKDVTLAEDGQQAVDCVRESLARQRKYDIIFMDVQMPHVDGLQSTRMIRELGYSAPIIALTAFAEEKNVKDCFESGMDYFLAKPLKRPQIRHVLKTYCQTISEEPGSPGIKAEGSKGKNKKEKKAKKGKEKKEGKGEGKEEKAEKREEPVAKPKEETIPSTSDPGPVGPRQDAP